MIVKLQNALFEIGFTEHAARGFGNLIAVTQLMSKRWSVEEMQRQQTRWAPPTRTKNINSGDLDADQMISITQMMLDLEMTEGEIAMFICHVRVTLILTQFIRRRIKELPPHLMSPVLN